MVKIDMPMPEYCYFCRFRLSTGIGQRCVAELGRVIDVNVIERPEWCPLKEQEAVRPERQHSGGGTTWWNICGNCRTAINPNDKFCHECGKAVKWDG